MKHANWDMEKVYTANLTRLNDYIVVLRIPLFLMRLCSNESKSLLFSSTQFLCTLIYNVQKYRMILKFHKYLKSNTKLFEKEIVYSVPFCYKGLITTGTFETINISEN